MIDNGSGTNLIKKSALSPEILIDFTKKGSLVGINDVPVETLGTVTLLIRKIPAKFQVVNDDFPIEQEAMIGRTFLQSTKAIVNYYYDTLILEGDPMNPIPFIKNHPDSPRPNTRVFSVNQTKAQSRKPEVERSEVLRITLQPRTKQLITLPLNDSQPKEGYLPRINVGDPAVFIGEALVSNENSSCQILAINANEHETTFDVYPRDI